MISFLDEKATNHLDMRLLICFPGERRPSWMRGREREGEREREREREREKERERKYERERE